MVSQWQYLNVFFLFFCFLWASPKSVTCYKVILHCYYNTCHVWRHLLWLAVCKRAFWQHSPLSTKHQMRKYILEEWKSLTENLWHLYCFLPLLATLLYSPDRESQWIWLMLWVGKGISEKFTNEYTRMYYRLFHTFINAVLTADQS